MSNPVLPESPLLRVCYTFLGYLLLPLLMLRLLWRSRQLPAYRQRWRERLGFYGAATVPTDQCVVFHAVSVGEVHAAQPLIDEFRKQCPDTRIVVTTTTPTGSDRVRALFGDQVDHVYLPWDLPGPARRFLTAFRPTLLVLMETELWPNLLAGCQRYESRVVLVNARLSEKSSQGYRRLGALTRSMLGSINAIAAQSGDDARRFVALGYPETAVQVTGSLKFDMKLDPAKITRGRQFRQHFAERPVWIAASTREGEEQKVLRAHAQALQALPDLLLVLVPRHPERFDLAVQLAEAQGLQSLRYSNGTLPDDGTRVLVGDTMGDLAFYYSLADVAFVGGSLVDTGCQNVIEPAALGLPVITGPSRFNFQAISDELLQAGALHEVDNEAKLAAAVARFVRDDAARESAASAAFAVASRNQGATARVCTLLLEQLQVC
jgi:3-deoxy-D-manno-octulosonic-acid transferase